MEREGNDRPAAIALIVLALCACALLLLKSEEFSAAQDPDLTPWAFLPYVGREPAPPPTLRVQGHVRLEGGLGLGNVQIRAGVTCNPGLSGWLIAVTDEKGEFQTDIGCPLGHDETLQFRAEREGYAFEPAYTCVRTYGYCPTIWLSFVGTPHGIADL